MRPVTLPPAANRPVAERDALVARCQEYEAMLKEANNDVRLLLDIRSLNERGAKPHTGVIPVIRERLRLRREALA